MINNEKFKNKYRVKSARLPHWNYAEDGRYFITVCAKDRENYFGDVINGKMKHSAIGEIVKNELLKTEIMRPNIKLDKWIIMPNHIHAIVIIENVAPVQTQCIASVQTQCIGLTMNMEKSAPVQTQCIGLTMNMEKSAPVETQCIASLRDAMPYKNKFGPQKNNLSSIIRGFKMSVKTLCNKNNIDFAWQPRFYDHIIRNEKSLMNIREYIINNPLKWSCDRDYFFKEAQEIEEIINK